MERTAEEKPQAFSQRKDAADKKSKAARRMTERLYYDNAYLREFDAAVLACEPEGDAWRVRLNRSAFYPTSGGQPYDTGTLGGAGVTDVYVDADGEVWHVTDAPLAVGDNVAGRIDWARRFDHMQQHAGEHILAGACYRHFSGHTIGLHLGKDDSSIDVELPDGRTRLTAEELCALEDDVNRHIQADVPIRCWFPEAEELEALPLRKPPTVKEHVRVVQIGDDEFCACGGTHPSSAGQIGLVKIVDARPSRGKLRLTFVCGMRAFLYFRRICDAATAAAGVLSTGWESLPEKVEALNVRARDAEYHLNRERRERALEGVDALRDGAERVGRLRVATHVYDGLPADALRDVASALIEQPDTVALLADRTENGCLLLFARSENVTLHVGRLLCEAAKAFGGKGGGRPDFAQGAASSAEAAAFALARLREENTHDLT